MTNPDREKNIGRFTDDLEVDLAVKEAVRIALAEHKRKGNTIAVWYAGEDRMIKPEDIQIPVDSSNEKVGP